MKALCNLTGIGTTITQRALQNECTIFQYMMTSSNGNIFRVTGHLCGKFTGPRWISRTKASDAELWCSFDMRPNIRLSKQSRGWWFETPPQSLWRHRNESLDQNYGDTISIHSVFYKICEWFRCVMLCCCCSTVLARCVFFSCTQL